MGWLLLGIGAAWLLYALNVDTSVPLPHGAGWPGRVQNLSLMEHRRTHLMLSGGVLIAGVLLMGFGTLQRSANDDDLSDDEDYRQCPFCAEPVRVEAVICRHCRSALPAVAVDDVEPDEEAEVSAEDPVDAGHTYSYRALREAAEAAERGQ
ncbi:hypothetical protein [Lysobacter terrae]